MTRLFETTRPPRVLIFGSRRWASLEALRELMWPTILALPMGATVVEGDALGADRCARHLAGELARGIDWRGDQIETGRTLTVISVPPVGDDPARFHRRNVAMAQLLDGPDDFAHGFLSGPSGEWTSGSADMARVLRAAGITYVPHWLDRTNVEPNERGR